MASTSVVFPWSTCAMMAILRVLKEPLFTDIRKFHGLTRSLRGAANTRSGYDVRRYTFAPPNKKRPVVVLTRESAIASLSTVTVAPVTSTIRGVPFEVVLNEEDAMNESCAVNLHNA